MDTTAEAPLYARVGRQLQGPLHGALVPLGHEAGGAQHDRRLRRLTFAMAALAVFSVVALGAQLVRAAGRDAAHHQPNVGAGLATAAHATPRASSSPAADASER